MYLSNIWRTRHVHRGHHRWYIIGWRHLRKQWWIWCIIRTTFFRVCVASGRRSFPLRSHFVSIVYNSQEESTRYCRKNGEFECGRARKEHCGVGIFECKWEGYFRYRWIVLQNLWALSIFKISISNMGIFKYFSFLNYLIFKERKLNEWVPFQSHLNQNFPKWRLWLV